MLYTVSEPQRIIRPADPGVCAALRLLEEAIHREAESRLRDTLTAASYDRVAARAGAMVDRLARIAEYLEHTPPLPSSGLVRP
jgi:hypothetical protein